MFTANLNSLYLRLILKRMVFVIQGREELLTFTSLRGACWSHTSKNMRPPFQSKFSSHIAVKVRPTVGFVKKSVYFNLIGQIHCNSLQDHKWRLNSRFWWRMWGFSELRLRLRLRLSKKIATLSDWLKNRAPVFQTMRSETNQLRLAREDCLHYSLTRVEER